MNAQEAKIPFPWLVFNEKVKVNSVFLRDSTGVSDSVVLLFGGHVSRGGLVSYGLLGCIALLSSWLCSFGFKFPFACSKCSFLYVSGWLHENAGWIFGIFHEA